MADNDELKKAVVAALAPARFRPQVERVARTGDPWPIRARGDVLVGALAYAPRIGILLWRIKWNRERTEAMLTEAAILVASYLMNGRANGQRRRPTMILQRIGRTALAEWVENECPTCKGGGFLVFGPADKKTQERERWEWVACAKCGGGGRVPLPGVPWSARTEVPQRWHNLSLPCATTPSGKGCDGVGRIRKTRSSQAGRVRCPDCADGRVPFGDFQRSRDVGLPLHVFVERWSGKYGEAMEYMKRMDERVASAIDMVIRPTQNRDSRSALQAAQSASNDTAELDASGDDSPESTPSGIAFSKIAANGA